MKIDLISGFLGAGKTTLIKKMLEEKAFPGKIVVIENEFGSVGIDGTLLKDTGVSVREISSGCICCTLAGDFNAALKDVVKKYRPDRIVIEPSGVGKLSDIMDSCRSVLQKEGGGFGICAAVADATKYAMYAENFSEFFLDQIKNARTVILSRTQKATAEKLESTVKSIRKQNPGANIVTTPWDQLSAEKLLAVAEEREPELIGEMRPDWEQPHHEDCGCGHHHHDHEHEHEHDHQEGHEHCHDADEAFEVWSMETPKVFQSRGIDEVLQTIGRYGTVLRAKGIVPVEDGRWVQFDYVPGEASQKEIASDYTGRLCVIGQDLDRPGLASLFGVS